MSVLAPPAPTKQGGAPGRSATGSALLRCVLGYEPVIDTTREVIALRLCLQPDEAHGVTLPEWYGQLASRLRSTSRPILLSVPAAHIIPGDARDIAPHRDLWLEVSGEHAVDPAMRPLLQALLVRGVPLVLASRPPQAVDPELLAAFRLSLIHVRDDRRLTGGPEGSAHRRIIPHAQEGVDSLEHMEHCFARGASAVVGWPMSDALGFPGRGDVPPDRNGIVRMLNLIGEGEDPDQLAAILRRDPATSCRLLRHVVREGREGRTGIHSLRQAMMLLGYGELKRWLNRTLQSSASDMNLKPLLLASYRRGVLLEYLSGSADPVARDEAFLVGTFSLLDKLMNAPFATLLPEMGLTPGVRSALEDRGGRYRPWLELVEAVEGKADRARMMALIEAAGTTIEHCNEALLRGLLAPELAA